MYLGLNLRFFGREARAAGENGVNMSVIATQERRMIPPLESVLPWPFRSAPGWGCEIPSVLGLELVGSAMVLDEAWKWWRDENAEWKARRG